MARRRNFFSWMNAARIFRKLGYNPGNNWEAPVVIGDLTEPFIAALKAGMPPA
jgi:hypothetical protein